MDDSFPLHGAILDGDLDLYAPLHLACHAYPRSAMCKLLLENGANPNQQTPEGVTPLLDFLLFTDRLEDIQLLLNYGADISAVDQRGNNALHYAARNIHSDIVEFLVLDHGFDVECNNHKNQSPLHLAADRCNSTVCEFLLKHNAKVNRRDLRYRTPLFYTIRNGRRDAEVTAEVLLQYGAVLFDESTSWSALKTADEYSSDGMKLLIVRKLAEMKILDLSVSDDDRRLIENNDVYKKYYEEHYKMLLQDVQEMKKTKFYKNVSIFNILMGSKKEICGYARNEDLVEALKEEDYENRFSIYFTSLMKIFHVEVKRQRSRKVAANVLSYLFELNDSSHPVIRKIVSYLRDEDLGYLKTNIESIAALIVEC